MRKMLANVFESTNVIRVKEVEMPHANLGEAVIRITLTTICGTDLHILKGEYPVKPGLIIGHEPVGVIEELGPGVTGYKTGSEFWWAPSLPAANAVLVFRVSIHNVERKLVMKPWADGVSETPSTALKRNICSCRMLKRILQRFPTA